MKKENDAYTIPLLNQPDKLGKALTPIAKLMTEEMASQPDWDYKTGNLPTPDFPRPLNVYFNIWAFLMDSNEIIANLNIVLSDLKILRDDPVLFQKHIPGDPILRYKLLARTYFYEFFRFKECFTFFLARLRKINFINTKYAKEIKSLFYSVFEPALNIRNTMIHNRFLWGGEGHLKLSATLSAESVGGFVIDKETGAVYDKTKILSDIADDTIQIFFDEGISVKSCFEDIIESVTENVHKSEGLAEV